jgi:hypothetical protein
VNALEQFMRQNRVFLLLTADKLISRNLNKNARQPLQFSDSMQVSEFKDMQSFAITHERWQMLAGAIKSWGIPAMLSFMSVVLLFSLCVINFICTLFTSIAVMIIGSIAKARLDFSSSMRLAAAARIPATIFSLLPLPLSGVTGWIVWLLYLIFAVWAVRLHDGYKAQ